MPRFSAAFAGIDKSLERQGIVSPIRADVGQEPVSGRSERKRCTVTPHFPEPDFRFGLVVDGNIVNGKMTGGFAFVAYPEKYGDTGITTFIIDQSGIVYEKNLGKDTPEMAKAMTEFNPDKTWNPVPE